MNLDNNNIIIARCGLKTNGDIHIGNMLPIIYGFIIGKKIFQEGKKLRFIIMLVDLEQNKNKKAGKAQQGASQQLKTLSQKLQ